MHIVGPDVVTRVRRPRIIAIVLVWVCVASAFAAYTSPQLQLVFAVATLTFLGAILASVFALVRDWRLLGWWAALPLVICLLAMPASRFLGSGIHAVLFNSHVPQYRKLVDRIDKEELLDRTGSTIVVLKPEEKQLAYFVLAERRSDKELLVELATERGFPVKHRGYVFSSTGAFVTDSEIGRRWPYVRRIGDQWFRVSD
jgi:hypothetical protein